MESNFSTFNKIEQKIGGSRKISNYIIGGMLTIGGIGFVLASVSSYTGKDLLPLGNPSNLLFVPQGIIMGAYGVLANLLNFYLLIIYKSDHLINYLEVLQLILYPCTLPLEGH